MRSRIFFRNDDVWDMDANFKTMIGLFLWHGIPIHLAVIPGRMTVACKVFLKKCLNKYPSLVEIGQHGYQHVNYSDTQFPYEFGPARTYREQKADILAGWDILQQDFSAVRVFTPPWHGYDQNTLKALCEGHFQGISTDHKSQVLSRMPHLNNTFVNIYVNKRSLSGWFVERPAVLLRDVQALAGTTAGILLHHKTFNNKEEFAALNRFLAHLKQEPHVSFCRMSQVNDVAITGDI